MTSFSQWLLTEEALPPQLRAWHGGAAFDDFDMNHVGQGEQRSGRINAAQGPGIYFSDCENIAKLYVKYAQGRAALHEVILDTRGLIDYRNGTPSLRPALDALEQKYQVRDAYRDIFRRLPVEKAIAELVSNGIDGQFQRLPGGCLEIVVINPAIIRKIGSKRLNADLSDVTPEQLEKEKAEDEHFRATRFKPEVEPEPGVSGSWFATQNDFYEKAYKVLPQYKDIFDLITNISDDATATEPMFLLDDLMNDATYGTRPDFTEFFRSLDAKSRAVLGKPLASKFADDFVKLAMPFCVALFVN